MRIMRKTGPQCAQRWVNRVCLRYDDHIFNGLLNQSASWKPGAVQFDLSVKPANSTVLPSLLLTLRLGRQVKSSPTCANQAYFCAGFEDMQVVFHRVPVLAGHLNYISDGCAATLSEKL